LSEGEEEEDGGGDELLNIGTQAPAPLKDYCQLIVLKNKVTLKRYKVSLHSTWESRYPTCTSDRHREFLKDDHLQYEIESVFGKEMLDYVLSIVESEQELAEQQQRRYAAYKSLRRQQQY